MKGHLLSKYCSTLERFGNFAQHCTAVNNSNVCFADIVQPQHQKADCEKVKHRNIPQREE